MILFASIFIRMGCKFVLFLNKIFQMRLLKIFIYSTFSIGSENLHSSSSIFRIFWLIGNYLHPSFCRISLYWRNTKNKWIFPKWILKFESSCFSSKIFFFISLMEKMKHFHNCLCSGIEDAIKLISPQGMRKAEEKSCMPKFSSSNENIFQELTILCFVHYVCSISLMMFF